MKKIMLSILFLAGIISTAVFGQRHDHHNDNRDCDDDRYSYESGRSHHDDDDNGRYNNRGDCRRSLFQIQHLRVSEYGRNRFAVQLRGEGPKHTVARSRWRGNDFYIYLDSDRECHTRNERDFRFEINLGKLPPRGHFQVFVVDNDTNRKIGEIEF